MKDGSGAVSFYTTVYIYTACQAGLVNTCFNTIERCFLISCFGKIKESFIVVVYGVAFCYSIGVVRWNYHHYF